MSANNTDASQDDESARDSPNPKASCVQCGELVGTDAANSAIGPLCSICIDSFLAAGQGGIFEHVGDGGYGKDDK